VCRQHQCGANFRASRAKTIYTRFSPSSRRLHTCIAFCFVDEAASPKEKGLIMTKHSLRHLFRLSVLTSATLFALSTHATLQEHKQDQQERKNDRHDDDDDQDRDGDRRPRGARPALTQVPPAQFNRVLWRGLMGEKLYPVQLGQGQVSGTKDEK
jgi:hypothetical protein